MFKEMTTFVFFVMTGYKFRLFFFMRDNYLTPVLIVSSLSAYYVAKHLLLQLLTFLGAERPLQIICSHKIRYSEGYSLAVRNMSVLHKS